MTAFRQETRWEPENGQGWRDLGVTLEKLGRDDEAREALAKAVELEAAAGTKDARPGKIAGIDSGERPKVSLPPGLEIRLPAKGNSSSS
jgi:hypothetical protein